MEEACFRRATPGGTTTRPALVHFSSAGYTVRTSVVGRSEYRGGAERLGRRSSESIPGDAPGDSVSRSALDVSSDRTVGTVLDARQRVRHVGQGRSQEKTGGAARADARRSRGRRGGGGALPSGRVEARLH